MPTCYRHPNRETGVACSSCGRPICPDCMTATQVGMRCPECGRQRTKVVRMREMASVPRVTYALIVINAVVFLTEKGQFTFTGEAYGKVVEEGELYRAAISEGHQYYRLVSSAFLHADLLHIGFNMYLLYLLGMMLEPAIGSVRFAAIYFTSLLAGSCGALVATSAPSLGASGAIFGLMGAAVVELRARGLSVMESGIGALIVFNLILSFTVANISVGAHIGGLIGGLLAGLAFRLSAGRYALALGVLACVALSVAAVAGGLAAAQSTAAGIV
ncbi:MAG TPA: rhomboid family intramembrane serine protease [Solirubrobacteraceae bacterium]|jgi:membrane associated rhomboid family serine protease|nr:rhomboid family intramembrane serine protease [Solirubrobacteraceae bacterium]